jgi:hypothetical protein
VSRSRPGLLTRRRDTLGPPPSYVGASGVATGATNTVAGLQLGDLIIRTGYPYGGDADLDAWGTPISVNGFAPRAYKFADASDLDGWPTSGQTIDVAFAYRGVGSVTGLTSTAQNTTRPKTISGISTGVDNCTVIAVLEGFDDNTVVWTGATERFDVNTTASLDSTYSLADVVQASAGAVGDISAQLSASGDNHQVWALILQPTGA